MPLGRTFHVKHASAVPWAPRTRGSNRRAERAPPTDGRDAKPQPVAAALVTHHTNVGRSAQPARRLKHSRCHLRFPPDGLDRCPTPPPTDMPMPVSRETSGSASDELYSADRPPDTASSPLAMTLPHRVARLTAGPKSTSLVGVLCTMHGGTNAGHRTSGRYGRATFKRSQQSVATGGGRLAATNVHSIARTAGFQSRGPADAGPASSDAALRGVPHIPRGRRSRQRTPGRSHLSTGTDVSFEEPNRPDTQPAATHDIGRAQTRGAIGCRR